MNDAWINLKIEGRREELSARALARGATTLLRLVERAAKLGTRGSHEPTFVVEGLSLGSISMQLGTGLGSTDAEPRGIQNINDGIGLLANRSDIPEGWSREMLRDLRIICEMNQLPGATGVVISGSGLSEIKVSDNVLRNVIRVLAPPRDSMGSIVGVVTEWKGVRSGDQLTIRDESSGEDLIVEVPLELGVDTGSAIRKRVLVRGQMTRSDTGRKIRLIASSLEIKETRKKMSIRDIAGALGSDWTGGLDVVEWQRIQRG